MQEKKRATKRAQREFIEKMRTFEKRSKFITIKTCRTIWGLCVVHIDVTNEESKVVKEMMDYLMNLFGQWVEEDIYSTWFHNYDNYADDDSDEWELQFEICVSKVK